jgi:hypothetical protein
MVVLIKKIDEKLTLRNVLEKILYENQSFDDLK